MREILSIVWTVKGSFCAKRPVAKRKARTTTTMVLFYILRGSPGSGRIRAGARLESCRQRDSPAKRVESERRCTQGSDAPVRQLGKLRPIANRPTAALAPYSGGSQPPRRLPACPTSRSNSLYLAHSTDLPSHSPRPVPSPGHD